MIAAIVGSGLLAIVDATIGLRTPGTTISGGRQHAFFFGMALQHALSLGIGAGAVLAILQWLLGDLRVPLRRGRRASVTTLVVSVGAVVAFLWLTRSLFEGPWVARQTWGPAAKYLFTAAAAIMVPVATFAAARSVSRETRGRRWFACCWFAAGVGLIVVNASAYRNQYPDIHLLLVIASFAAFGLAAFGLFDGSRLDAASSRSRATVLATLALATIAAVTLAPSMAGLGQKAARVRAAFEARVWGIAQVSRFTDPLFQSVARTPAAPTADVGDLLSRLAPQLGKFSTNPTLLDGSQATPEAIAAMLDQAIPGRRKLNVVWVALDTLRADHVGCLGYSRRTTPVLDAFASGGLLFEHAYTPYPTSAYAYSSVLSSLPSRISPHFAGAFQRPWKYPSGQVFPRLLKASGFTTTAVTAFNAVDLESPVMFKSLREGFDVFNPDQAPSAANAEQVTASAIGVLEKSAKDRSRPFFLWVHYLDPHDPYDHHPQFDFGPSALDCYDSEIAWTDFHVGKLLAAISDLGLLDDTVIAIFSDHGEEFDEHGGRYHNGTVYEEQIRVPLAIRVPGLRPKRVSATVSLLDIVPTLITLLDLKDVAPRMGRDLLPFALGDPPPEGGLAVSEVFTIRAGVHSRDERAVILGREKLIHRVQKNSYEFFDLAKDPGERESLIGRGDSSDAKLRGLLAAWNGAIDAWIAAQEGTGRPKVDADVKAVLDRLEKMTRPDEVKRGATQLENLLVTGYGDPHQRLVAELDPSTIEGVFDLVKSRYGSLPQAARPAAIRALASRSTPDLGPFFRAELTGPIETAVEAALALALRDDPAAAPILVSALQSNEITDKGGVAWGLARLGDLSAADWLTANIYSCRFGRNFREAVRALQKSDPAARAAAGKPTPARILRTRLFEEAYRHPEVNASIISACDTWPEEDATLILLRLARDNDVDTRRIAEEALKRRMSADVLQRNRAAMDEELDADAALVNVLPDVAVDRYRRALGAGTLFNSGLRVRMARALSLASKVAEARDVLSDLSANAPLVYDRRLAERLASQLAWPLFVDDPKFKCTVLDVEVPGVIRSGENFGARFKLRNDGEQPWRGGWFSGIPDLRLRFVLPSGKTHETQTELNVVNYFDEAGVNPGETVDVLLIGVGMRGHPEGTLTLSFKNDRIGYPNAGLVWKHSASTRIG